jgi:hypothetical protein
LHRKLIDILGEIEHFIVDAFQSFAENNWNISLVIWKLHLHGRVILVEWVWTLKHVSASDTCARPSDTSLAGVLLVQKVVFRHEVVGVLLLVWINTSLGSVDVAFAILSIRLRLLNVKSILLNIAILFLIFSSVVDCDVFVRVLLVYLRQMLLSQI